MYKYLEIKEMGTNKVVKRIDVTDMSDSSISRLESGMGMNLNHNKYYIDDNESKTPLELI